MFLFSTESQLSVAYGGAGPTSTRCGHSHLWQHAEVRGVRTPNTRIDSTSIPSQVTGEYNTLKKTAVPSFVLMSRAPKSSRTIYVSADRRRERIVYKKF